MQYISIIVTLFIGVFFQKKIRNNPSSGLTYILIIYIFLSGSTTLGLYKNTVLYNLGLFDVKPMDLVSIFLIPTIISRYRIILTKSKYSITARILLVLVIYNFLLILAYMPIHGFTKELAAGRRIIPGAIVFLYFLSHHLNNQKIKNIYHVLTIFAVIIVIYGLLRIILGFVNPNFITQTSRIFEDGGRAVYGYAPQFATMFFLVSFVLYLNNQLNYKFGKLLLVLSLLFIALASHRSIWIMAITGIFVILFYYRKKAAKIIQGSLIAGFFIILLLLFSPPNLKSRVANYLDNYLVTSEEEFKESTGQYRFERWSAHFEQNYSPTDIIQGKGYGWDRSVKVRARTIYTSMHNAYIEYLFDGGVITLLLLILFYISYFKGYNKLKFYDYRTSVTFISLLIIYIPGGFVNGYSIFFWLTAGIGSSFISSLNTMIRLNIINSNKDKTQVNKS